jgi:hypothetical protein
LISAFFMREKRRRQSRLHGGAAPDASFVRKQLLITALPCPRVVIAMKQTL